tara:strand:+ start:13342 stop:13485 length:144 start_codon:yes stop_codon:yes gene_type:complete
MWESISFGNPEKTVALLIKYLFGIVSNPVYLWTFLDWESDLKINEAK